MVTYTTGCLNLRYRTDIWCVERVGVDSVDLNSCREIVGGGGGLRTGEACSATKIILK